MWTISYREYQDCNKEMWLYCLQDADLWGLLVTIVLFALFQTLSRRIVERETVDCQPHARLASPQRESGLAGQVAPRFFLHDGSGCTKRRRHR